jgi:glycosyltransferase involved in cell wall biosynthesis
MPSNVIRVGYLGQVKYHKGVDLLLEAWGKLHGSRPRRLAIYGADRGEEKYGKRIQSRIEHLEEVYWNGAFQGKKAGEVLNELDVLVVPSRYPENSPNVILEAQAAGIPVIGSNLGGIPELVRHDVNGLLFEPNNPADLAKQLQRVLDEHDLLPRLARAVVRQYSIEDELAQLCDFYAQALQTRLTRKNGDTRDIQPG